jgi:hypothetical protein
VGATLVVAPVAGLVGATTGAPLPLIQNVNGRQEVLLPIRFPLSILGSKAFRFFR